MIVGISHKAYFGYQQTQQWCEAVAAMLRQPALARAPVELFTFPAMPTLPVALCAFADTRMATGAQNVCEAPAGAGPKPAPACYRRWAAGTWKSVTPSAAVTLAKRSR